MSNHYEVIPYTFLRWYIPTRMMGGLNRYIKDGIPPGDFLNAVLENDLSEACGRADDENLGNIPAYMAFLYNDAPVQCWGSKEKVVAWVKHKIAERERAEAERVVAG